MRKRQPSQRAQRSCVEYGQSKRFERIGFGLFDRDPADRVDQLREVGEVDDDDVVHRDAGEVADGADRERGAAELEGGVDLAGAVPRDVDAEVARDREVRDAGCATGSVRTSMIESERRAEPRPARPARGRCRRARIVVGWFDEQPVLRGERRARVVRQPVVRARRRPCDGEVAERRARRRRARGAAGRPSRTTSARARAASALGRRDGAPRPPAVRVRPRDAAEPCP